MPSTYQSDYMFYASENEASPTLHKWASIMTLSAAMSRKTWFPQGDWLIHPNLYVFFVGAPGDCKSVAMSLAQKVIHDFTDIEIAPDQITREALTQFLQKSCQKQFAYDNKLIDYSPITIFSDELVILLGAEPLRMIDILTILYNNQATLKINTKNQGSDHIIRPCVTLLGCLTPSTLNNMLTQNLISGGFCRRMILVYTKDRVDNKPLPKMSAAHLSAKSRCIEHAKRVQQLTGPFALTPEAEEFFIDWYMNTKSRQRKTATSDVMRHWFGSKDTPLLKVSMCLSVMDSLDMKIELDHLQEALALIDDTEKDIMSVLGGGGRNDLAPITRRIEAYIQANPGVTSKRIQSEFYNDANAEELTRILQHLVTTEACRFENKPSTNNLSVAHYYATQS